MHPITDQLASLIQKNGWQPKFEQCIAATQKLNIPALAAITSVDEYLKYVDGFATWAPRSPGDSHMIYQKIAEFYFILDQEPVRSLQNPIEPGKGAQQLTPLSAWIDDFAKSWGSYLDTPESAKEIESFKTAPNFNWDEYMPPPSGYRTFNQFMAREVKPGMRPVAALNDPTVLVAPADSTFVGWWQISEKSEIFVESKGLRWSIHQLLEGSPYADRFKNGIFTHSFLNTTDYHRWHTPVPGKVVEARVIQGQAFLDVEAIPGVVGGKKGNVLNCLDQTGYQFVQTRGLAVLDSPIGLVACIPMGMAQVSSVVMTAETGRELRKGEELGYFAFGGSDFVMVFEQRSNVHLDWQPGVHLRQGMAIGKAFRQN
jgi:phosphatidylserine decarboxylase precursor